VFFASSAKNQARQLSFHKDSLDFLQDERSSAGAGALNPDTRRATPGCLFSFVQRSRGTEAQQGLLRGGSARKEAFSHQQSAASQSKWAKMNSVEKQRCQDVLVRAVFTFKNEVGCRKRSASGRRCRSLKTKQIATGS
jgi:hypothetical protein